MNFNGQHNLVLAGRKGEHWSPRTEGELAPWRAGRSYAIQARAGAAALGHVKVLAALGRRLEDVSLASARRSGHESVEDFFNWWEEVHGPWTQHDPVWVAVFTIDVDRPRLLAADSTYGYTHDPNMALPHEPEAVDAATQERLTVEAQAGAPNRRATMRARLAQIRQQGNKAIREGRDPTPHLDAALDRLKEG